MKNKLSFTIPIIPRAQMRARSMARGGHAITYKAKEQRQNEEQIMQLLEKYMPSEPLQGALSIIVKAFLPIPLSKPEWWKNAANECLIYPTVRPDIDNIIKFILDTIGAMCYFNDDSQVVKIIAEKYYSVSPRWEISLREFKQPKNKKEYINRMVSHKTSCG